MDHVKLEIDGMSCGHCVNSVRKALEGIPGVSVENVGIGSAAVAYDPLTTSPGAVERAVEHAGYAVLNSSGRAG